jgi:hypothetical protein
MRDLPLPTTGEGAILGPTTTPNPGNVGSNGVSNMANPNYVLCKIIRLGAQSDSGNPANPQTQIALADAGGAWGDTIFTVVPEVTREVLAVALTAISNRFTVIQASIDRTTHRCYGLVIVNPQ